MKEIRHPEGTLYEHGEFNCDQGISWSVAIIEIGAGNVVAALETERAIQHFNPSVIFFVGIAGGLKDVRHRDVVAATKVYGYESGKATTHFQPRPNVGESSYQMIQRARAEARKDNWLRRMKGSSPKPQPRVFVGPIAAGEKVVTSKRSAIWRFLRQAYGDALAVEMEGRGFLDAAHANQRVNALIVRGISDLVDHKTQSDAKGYQQLAAQMASAFAFEVLANLEVGQNDETGEYVLVLSATIAEVDKTKAVAIVAHLRKLSKDATLTLTRVEEGSVKLVLEGTREGFDCLHALFSSGKLSKVREFPIVGITWIGTQPEKARVPDDLDATIEQCLPAAVARVGIARRGQSMTTIPPIIRTPTALVIEDEANWQREITEILRAQGLDVDVSTNSFEAMALIDRKSYDVVTIDIHGLSDNRTTAWETVAQHIRNRSPRTRTLVVTGDTKLQTAINAINNYHVAGYFMKENFTAAEFDRKLRELISAEPVQADEFKYDVFISYSVKDAKVSREIEKLFRAQELQCFLAEKDIQTGTLWKDEIREALWGSRVVVLLLTPNSISSKWVMCEAGAFWAINKPLVPTSMLVNIADVPELISSYHCRRIESAEDRKKLATEVYQLCRR